MRSEFLAAGLLLLAIGEMAFISNLQKGSVTGESTGRSANETTNVSSCITGNSKGGSCVDGVPAGITYATTDLNWKQTISTSLTGGSRATVTLAPCPAGVDTVSGAGYQLYLSGGGNSEADNVIATAGGCTSGASSGTIALTPIYSYPAGYTISLASSGI